MARIKPGHPLLFCLLVLASLLLAAGLVMPMITISRFIYIRNSFSVVSGILELMNNGQAVLGIFIAGFSVVLPVLKIVLLFMALSGASPDSPGGRKILERLHRWGRWAMLDVMVAAVLVVTVKLGAVASVEVHPGLYAFGASALLVMGITDRILRLAERE